MKRVRLVSNGKGGKKAIIRGFGIDPRKRKPEKPMSNQKAHEMIHYMVKAKSWRDCYFCNP